MLRLKTLMPLTCLCLFHCVVCSAEEGVFSRQASSLWTNATYHSPPIVVLSPDRKSKVVATFHPGAGPFHLGETILRTEGALGSIRVNIGAGVGAEVLWSSDSRAFFITTSLGGGIGPYQLIVVDTFHGKLRSRNLTNLVQDHFGNPVRCFTPSAPNVMGIGWVGQTHRIWAAAEVVPDTNCDSMGTFKAYEIEPYNRKILQSLNQLEAKRQLTQILGEALTSAPDECIHDPKSCYVLPNHPELDTDHKP